MTHPTPSPRLTKEQREELRERLREYDDNYAASRDGEEGKS